MEIKTLEKIGLTKNESKVYLTLIKEGSSKTGEILKNSGINSGKIYEILESLKNKGLVSESVVNRVKNFTSAPPSQILEYLEKKKREIEEDTELIKQELPKLEELQNKKTHKIKAITYTGFKGIKTAADEALSSMKEGEEILAMGVTEKKEKNFNEFWKLWSQKRINKKIIAKHIFSEYSSYYESFKKMRYTKVKILTGITPVTIDIFGKDKILILNYNPPYSCILIYDKDTATSFINFFKQLWNISKD